MSQNYRLPTRKLPLPRRVVEGIKRMIKVDPGVANLLKAIDTMIDEACGIETPYDPYFPSDCGALLFEIDGNVGRLVVEDSDGSRDVYRITVVREPRTEEDR